MSDKDSTIKSFVDKTTGAAKSIYGSVVGSDERRIEGDAQQNKGSLENDASQATAKVGPFSATSSGVATDNQDRTQGSWDQTMGSAKQAVGGFVGADSLKQSGKQQQRDGEAREAKGQATDVASGISDRLTGTVGGAVSSLTGNKKAEGAYAKQHNQGKTLQRGVEHDVSNEADAEKEEISHKAEEAKKQ